MKKIFVLLLSVGTVSSVFAQGYNDRKDARDVILGNDNHNVAYNDGYNKNDNDRRRKEAIDKINRDYDFQIAAVKRNRYMKGKEKDRQIQWLEKERASKIREVMQRFSDRKDVHLDRGNGRF